MNLFLLRISNSLHSTRFVMFCVGICIVFFTKAIFFSPYSPDSYLHLGLGHYIYDMHRVPKHQDVSFKQVEPLLEIFAHSWLTDLIGFIAEHTHPLLVTILLCSSFILSMIVLIRILKLLEIDKFLIILASSLASALSLIHWSFHPLPFLIPLLLLMIHQLISYQLKKTRSLQTLPILFILAANVAGGYLFIMFGILIMYVVVETLHDILLSSKKSDKWYKKLPIHFLSWSFFSALASIFSPYGIKNWLYVQTFTFIFDERKWFSTLAGTLSVTNSNYSRNAPSPVLFSIFLLYFLITILMFIFGFIRGKKQFFLQTYPVIPLLSVFIFALQWYRCIPLVTFLTLPAFTLACTMLLKRIHHSGFQKYVIYLFLLFYCLILIILIWPPKSHRFTPPSEQVAFIKENHLLPKFLPSIELGGYLFASFLPEKGHLDAQDDLFDEHDIMTLYGTNSAVPPEFIQNISNTYNINTIVSSKETDYLNLTVSNDPNWTLMYLDYNGYIFIKNENYPASFIQQHGLSHIELSRNLGFDPEKIDTTIEELKRFTEKYPTTLAMGQLASMYRFKKNSIQAENILLQIPKNSWDYIVWTEYGRVEASLEKCEPAEQAFLKALELRSEKELSRTVLDLAIVYAGCLHDTKKATHFFQRYNSFPLPPQEREKARQLAKKFGIILDEDIDKTENTQ